MSFTVSFGNKSALKGSTTRVSRQVKDYFNRFLKGGDISQDSLTLKEDTQMYLASKVPVETS